MIDTTIETLESRAMLTPSLSINDVTVVEGDTLATMLEPTMTVYVNGDFTDECDERIFVNLSGEVNATLSDAQGEATIQDDDIGGGGAGGGGGTCLVTDTSIGDATVDETGATATLMVGLMLASHEPTTSRSPPTAETAARRRLCKPRGQLWRIVCGRRMRPVRKNRGGCPSQTAFPAEQHRSTVINSVVARLHFQ